MLQVRTANEARVVNLFFYILPICRYNYPGYLDLTSTTIVLRICKANEARVVNLFFYPHTPYL